MAPFELCTSSWVQPPTHDLVDPQSLSCMTASDVKASERHKNSSGLTQLHLLQLLLRPYTWIRADNIGQGNNTVITVSLLRCPTVSPFLQLRCPTSRVLPLFLNSRLVIAAGRIPLVEGSAASSITTFSKLCRLFRNRQVGVCFLWISSCQRRQLWKMRRKIGDGFDRRTVAAKANDMRRKFQWCALIRGLVNTLPPSYLCWPVSYNLLMHPQPVLKLFSHPISGQSQTTAAVGFCSR